jgi:hypothetical protein
VTVHDRPTSPWKWRRSGLFATLPIGRVVGPTDVSAPAMHIMTYSADRRDLRHGRRPAAHLGKVITMNDLLTLAIEGHGGMRRWEQISRFRVAASITGAIWTLKGQPGLLDGVVLDGETRDQRQAPWDELQVAYFAGEANWNYFVAPFLLSRSDFIIEETAPWHEEGQTWRSALPVRVPRVRRIMVASRRRVYVRNPDGSTVRDSVSVAIDVTDVTFT